MDILYPSDYNRHFNPECLRMTLLLDIQDLKEGSGVNLQNNMEDLTKLYY